MSGFVHEAFTEWMMKVFDTNGVRRFRRSYDNAIIARAIVDLMDRVAKVGNVEPFLSDVALEVKNAGFIGGLKAAAAYQAVSRALPFEYGGLVYRVEGPTEKSGWKYEKTKRVVRGPGRLEDYAPAPPSPNSLNKRIDARLEELAQWTNIFALREEARKWVEPKLAEMAGEVDRLKARVAELEKSALG